MHFKVFGYSLKSPHPLTVSMLTFKYCTRDLRRYVFARGDHITLHDNNSNGENEGGAIALVDHIFIHQPSHVSDDTYLHCGYPCEGVG